MVRLSKLNGNHDPPVHGFIQVIGTVGGHDDKTIMPGRSTYMYNVIIFKSSDIEGHINFACHHKKWPKDAYFSATTSYLSISVSNMLTSCPPFSLVSKMASHSSKNKMASLILASLKMNLKFSPALILPNDGKLINNTYMQYI